MQLRKRLKAIASLVDRGSTVVDIGCDHALLDIYLTIYNQNKCFACDINANALKNAQENIQKYQLEEQITTVLSDGLENVEVESDSTLIISGMGTSTVKHILSHEKRDQFTTILIQSNNELWSLRTFLMQLHYRIEQEVLVLERGIYYVIMKWVPGRTRYSSFDRYFGPYLRTHEDPLKQDYIHYLLEQNQNILDQLPKNYWSKRRKRKQIISRLNKIKSTSNRST